VREFEEDVRISQREPLRRGPPVREFEEDVRISERESRVPAFLRDDGRRSEPGGLVLRQRDVETVDRLRRPRSPSPVRVRETRIVERTTSVSPPPPRRIERLERVDRVDREGIREREREDVRIRVRSPSRGASVERIRTRTRERSPSPPYVLRESERTRIIERERSPSPPPVERERERIRIIERERERISSPSSSSSPSPSPPPVVRGPTIEREVITHYRDIDHGMICYQPPGLVHLFSPHN
jgi:hypothetical protein